MRNIAFRLGKIDILCFSALSGMSFDHFKNWHRKKTLKNLAFLILFLTSGFTISESRSKSWCFVREGDDFFPKHIVSPAREDSFQLQEIFGGPLGARGRSGHTSPSAKRAHLELAKEFGISVKVLHFIAF